MRWISLVFGIVFALMGLNSVALLKTLDHPMSGVPVLLLVFAISGLFFFLFYKSMQSEKAAREFFLWLNQNGSMVMEHGAHYNGSMITPGTELRQYLMTVSIVVMTFKQPSRYYIQGVDNLAVANAGHSICTLFLGWWGFPWGPIYSIQSLAKNLGGGHRVTVGEILNR